ncbi:MAG: MFS transporter [Polyangiaceae bacterium]|nr:MFS transporter [Polyangiaceae bacterium]
MLLAGLGMFVIGSVASGLASTIHELIAFRALQGLGAGAVQPIVLTVVGDLYTPAERGRVQGFFGAVWGAAGVSGPLLGGAIVSSLSWRWIFLVNVPPGLAAMAVLWVVYKGRTRGRSRATPLDLLGAGAITLASVCLLLAASGVAPIATGSAGVLLAAGFVWVERRAADPVLPLSLLGRRLIAVTTSASLLTGAAMMGVLTFLPLRAGCARPLADRGGAGDRAVLVGWPIASAVTSRMIVRTGYRRPTWLGSVITVAALAALVPLVLGHAPPWALGLAMFGFGVGMGLANTAILIGVQASVDQGQRGVATATTMFSRTMGGALGVGGLGAVLAARLGERVPSDVTSALLDPHERERVLAIPGVVEALGNALQPVFVSCAVAAGLALLVVLAHPHDARS